MTNDNIIATEKLYYDEHEYIYGDGFYPCIEETTICSQPAIVEFLYNKIFNSWIQIGGICISGLDCDEGTNLLDFMNKKYDVKCISIYNLFSRQIYCEK